MKKSGWILMAVLAGALLGAWAIIANSQDPPAEDDSWMPRLEADRPLRGGSADPPASGRPGMGRRPMAPGGGPNGAGMMGVHRQHELERIKVEDPERYQRLMKIKDLALEYRSSKDEQRKQEIEKELQALVDQELSIQHQVSKRRVEDLERRLKRMKEVLKQREERWDEVVDYTVKEITGQNDYLKAWEGR